MSLAFIHIFQIWAFVSQCLAGQGQGRLAVTSTGVHEFDVVVRGNHIYNTM